MKTLKALSIVTLVALPAGAGLAQTQASAAAQSQTQGSAQVQPGGVPPLLMAQAQSYTDVMVQLETAGYGIENVRRTLLGRMQIEASNQEHRRVVVVSRSTGEILSDQIVEIFVRGGASGQAGTATGTGGAGATVGADVGVGVDIGIGGNGNGIGVDAGGQGGVGGGIGLN